MIHITYTMTNSYMWSLGKTDTQHALCFVHAGQRAPSARTIGS